MAFWNKKMKLGFSEYSELIQEVLIIDFNNIFSNPKVRASLGLNDSNTNRFAIDYTCISLFLMVDVFVNNPIEAPNQTDLLDDVTDKIFRRMLNVNATEENLSSYKAYYLNIFEDLDAHYDRSGESLMIIANYILNSEHYSPDFSGNFEKQKYITNMLTYTIAGYQHIVDNTTTIIKDNEITYEVNK